MDRKLLGVLTHSGVDDIGGTSLNERIAKEGGAPQSQKFFSAEEMEAFLVNHGHTPVLTNSAYEQLDGQPDVHAIPPTPTVSSRWKPILDRVENGERLEADEATILMDEAPFKSRSRSCAASSASCTGRFGYLRIRQEFKYNQCVCRDCKFCAFYTNPENKRAYTRSPEQILEEVKKAAAAGATQILIQGGLNPDLKLSYYEDCLRLIRDNVISGFIHSHRLKLSILLPRSTLRLRSVYSA